MSEPMILVADDGAVRTLTLNRPQALNSFTGAMHREFRAALDAAAADAAVRCVVVAGAGRAFCAGQDLHDDGMGVGGQANEVERIVAEHYKPMALALRAMPVPVVARVHGVAAGAGASLAFNCDIVVAARSASFIQAFSKIGLVPDGGGTWLLPRLAGRAAALALTFTGERLGADDAKALGLVWKVVDDDRLDAETRALAARLAAMPSKALAATRRMIDDALTMDYADALDREARVQGEMSRGGDYAEGVAAFVDKRAPTFRDR